MKTIDPIYNQPHHPKYGPVRRMHVILFQIYADEDMAEMERRLSDQLGTEWTHAMADLLDDRSEAAASRFILRYATSVVA